MRNTKAAFATFQVFESYRLIREKKRNAPGLDQLRRSETTPEP